MLGQRKLLMCSMCFLFVGPTLCWANVSLICVCGFYVQLALIGLTNIFFGLVFRSYTFLI